MAAKKNISESHCIFEFDESVAPLPQIQYSTRDNFDTNTTQTINNLVNIYQLNLTDDQ